MQGKNGKKQSATGGLTVTVTVCYGQNARSGGVRRAKKYCDVTVLPSNSYGVLRLAYDFLLMLSDGM